MHGGGHARHVVASEVFLFTTKIYIDIRKLQQTSLKSPRKKTKLYKSWDDRRTRRNNSWRRGRRSRQRMVAEVSRTHCLVRFDSRFQVPVVYTMRGVCVPYSETWMSFYDENGNLSELETIHLSWPTRQKGSKTFGRDRAAYGFTVLDFCFCRSTRPAQKYYSETWTSFRRKPENLSEPKNLPELEKFLFWM